MDVPVSRAWGGLDGRRIAVAAWVVLVVGAFAMAAVINSALALRPGPNEYDLPAWEARNFLNKWLWEVGHPFGDRRTQQEQDDDLRAFFAAVADVRRLERQGDPEAAASLKQAIGRRDRLENRAEATLEARIEAAAKQEGLKRDFGLFHALWPPVDLEFTTSPMTLAESPRDHIELKSTTLLQDGLDLPEVTALEQKAESKDNVSAVAFPIAGVGAYPTIIAYDSDYKDAVTVAAHEWTHNYLAFRPLGLHYYSNNDLRTINETVADVVGTELAADVLARWPLEGPANGGAAPGQPPSPAVDARAELVKLRGEVDALLAQGKVAEAERLMEERRQYLAANGYYIRKINQAFFAFTNLYAGEAGSPGATNPIGPKVDDLRRRAGSLSRFLAIVGDVTSAGDLDRALSELG